MRGGLIFSTVFFAVGCVSVQISIVVNERPIIGVLAQEVYENENTPNRSYIAASYVKFLEGAGAQVVPILIQKEDSYINEIFSKINGQVGHEGNAAKSEVTYLYYSLLIPGGSVYFSSTTGTGGYADTGRKLLKLAKASNEAGKYFPVWGTCLGFELMVWDELNGTKATTSCSAWNVVDRLKFTKDAMNSRIYGSAPKSIVKSLGSESIAANFHHECLSTENFTQFGLHKSYSYLTINYDASSNTTYVSTIEHRKYPFFAVIFHPEKNVYEWNTKETIPHSPSAVKAGQYFANFLVDQARRNANKFRDAEEENRYLIYNYHPTFTGADGSTFVEKYYFPLE